MNGTNLSLIWDEFTNYWYSSSYWCGMTSRTPMFPAWHRMLFGRPPRPAASMRRKSDSLASLSARQAEDIFGCLFPAEFFTSVPGSRNRVFPLPVIFWAFLCQILAGASCRSGLLK